MNKLLWLTCASFAFVAACVTINVYFPAAAAEKAADRIIEDVWGPTDEELGTGDEQSRLTPAPRTLLAAVAGRALDLVVPAAQAQPVDIDVDTPEIRAITESMRRRHAQLKPLLDAGAIGLTADANIDLRDRNAVPLAQRNSVRQLVAEENRDRDALYTEIARANGHPEWEPQIRATFAKRWVSRAEPGWYYRDAGGGWQAR